MSKKKWFNDAFAEVYTMRNESKRTSFSQNDESVAKRSRSFTRKSASVDGLTTISDIIVIEDDPVVNENEIVEFQTNWLEKFKPHTVEDLTIHPKKLEELRRWFEIYDQEKNEILNKILLVIGPTGSGKTVATKLVAKELFNYDISEWITPIDLESDLFYDNENRFVTYENQINKFQDFLLKSSRYGSIFTSKSRMLLVKDLPNTFLKNKTEEFWNVLRIYKQLGNAPLIFVLTDTNSRSLNVAYNLFPESIRMELQIEEINFNPISILLMKKALKRVTSIINSNSTFKKCFKEPSSNIYDGIVDQAQGDIRNAILNLNFASAKGGSNMLIPKTQEKGFQKGKGKGKKAKVNKKDHQVGSIGKNETLTTMHGLGRIFNPKYELTNSTKIQQLTHSPEVLAENFMPQPNTFIELIHSNAIKNFSSIDDLSQLTNLFSINDTFMTEYRDQNLHELNLNMIVRGAMTLNSEPASGFRAVGGFADKRFRNKQQENEEKYKTYSKVINNKNLVGKTDYYCDYKDYITIIKPVGLNF